MEWKPSRKAGIMHSSRLARVRKEGSPHFTYIPGAIAAAADNYIHINSQFPLSRKYSPLDWLEFTNNDSVNLTITINGNQPFPCPAGTIRTIKGKGVAVHTLNIHNDDAATATTQGLVVVTMQRQPEAAAVSLEVAG